MNTRNFPVIALALAVFIHLLLFMATTPDANGQTLLPLLTLLIIAEFGFIVSMVGAYVSGSQQLKDGLTATGILITLLCAALALSLMLQGIELWPL